MVNLKGNEFLYINFRLLYYDSIMPYILKYKYLREKRLALKINKEILFRHWKNDSKV